MAAKSAKKRAKKNPCWPGYEPVPGKRPYSKGSCRKKKTPKKAAATARRNKH